MCVARSTTPNAGNKWALRQALFDALVDCWERGIGEDALQCVDGRIARIVSSLALLDWDERNWGVLRVEERRNEVFARAQRAIRAAAEEAAALPADNPLHAAGKAFLATNPAELAAAGEVDPAAEAEFVAATRARIGRVVDAYAGGRGGLHVAAGLKTEAMAAVF